MRIATFNINNVNKRLANLLEWLDETKPDVVCLQELKAEDKNFPAKALDLAGYGSVWMGQKTWNGVAILARGSEPVLTCDQLPGDSTDKQSRYIEAAVDGILVGCAYFPNGNPQPGPKFDYKLAWMRRFRERGQELLAMKVPVVLAGDYNVAPTDIDIYPTRSWDTDALIQPESREAYRAIVDDGWIDALRRKHPKERIYSFWSYLRHRWDRDAGLRLDHLLVSPKLKRRLKAAGVDRDVRGRPDASDHAPVWIEIKD